MGGDPADQLVSQSRVCSQGSFVTPATQPITMNREKDHPTRRLTGAAAENLAVRFLEHRGHSVLVRNLVVGRGEIDILAQIDGERTVVEVRSRWAVGKNGSPDPLDAFDATKARQVKRLAAALSRPTSRVDLITVRFHRGGVDLLWLPRVV